MLLGGGGLSVCALGISLTLMAACLLVILNMLLAAFVVLFVLFGIMND